jgi:hypothetical protein
MKISRGEKMNKLSRKNKIIITAIVAITLVLSIAIPYVSAQNSANPIANSKTLNAKGYAYQTIDDQTIKKYPATFLLTLAATDTDRTVKLFDVTGGSVTVNGASYTITSGNGGVLTGKHAILLQAQGTSPDGEHVTFKLAGRYFWMGGNLYVVRIDAKLQTDNANYAMLMRAEIRR